MKKVLHSKMFLFLLGFVFVSSIGVYATIKIQASEIGYKNGSVEDALNYLYGRANNNNHGISKFCELEDGYTHLTVGAKYKCQLGENDKNQNNQLIYRYFYILKINNNSVDMIMDRNITDEISSHTLSWSDAINFFDSEIGISFINKWNNLIDTNINLPSIESLFNVIGFTLNNSEGSWNCFDGHKLNDYPWCSPNTNSEFSWLFNYLTDCENSGCDTESNSTSSGYWTSSKSYDNYHTWRVDKNGYLANGSSISNNTSNGVRPVITILKDNLSS